MNFSNASVNFTLLKILSACAQVPSFDTDFVLYFLLNDCSLLLFISCIKQVFQRAQITFVYCFLGK